MNLAELITAVEHRCGVATHREALVGAINEALDAVSTERDWEWLDGTWTFTTTAGKARYLPPWDWRAIRTVHIGEEHQAYLNIDQVDAGWRGWTVEGDELLLSPVPTGPMGVVVRLVRDEDELVANNDEPLLPDTWHRQVLVPHAAALLLDRTDQTARADRARADAEAGRRRMIRTGRRRKGPGRIRIRPGGAL